MWVKKYDYLHKGQFMNFNCSFDIYTYCSKCKQTRGYSRKTLYIHAKLFLVLTPSKENATHEPMEANL